jgi:hypothetical protein
MQEPWSGDIVICSGHVKQEQGGYFALWPCLVDPLEDEVHGVFGRRQLPSASVTAGKELVDVGQVGKPVSHDGFQGLAYVLRNAIGRYAFGCE